jgi:hypothetical protein
VLVKISHGHPARNTDEGACQLLGSFVIRQPTNKTIRARPRSRPVE